MGFINTETIPDNVFYRLYKIPLHNISTVKPYFIVVVLAFMQFHLVFLKRLTNSVS